MELNDKWRQRRGECSGAPARATLKHYRKGEGFGPLLHRPHGKGPVARATLQNIIPTWTNKNAPYFSATGKMRLFMQTFYDATVSIKIEIRRRIQLKRALKGTRFLDPYAIRHLLLMTTILTALKMFKHWREKRVEMWVGSRL